MFFNKSIQIAKRNVSGRETKREQAPSLHGLDELEIRDPKPDVCLLEENRTDAHHPDPNPSCEEQYFVSMSDQALLTAIASPKRGDRACSGRGEGATHGWGWHRIQKLST